MSIERAVNRLIQRLEETTTSADISYLPGGFTTMGTYMKTLSRMKPRWEVKVLEELDRYKVLFEDQMSIYVPKTCWDEFRTEVLKVYKAIGPDYSVDLKGYLDEAKEIDLQTAFKNLEGAFLRMVAEPPVLDADVNVARWSDIFGVVDYVTSKLVMLTFETLEKDIDAAIAKLKKVYVNAVGHYQMIADALEKQEVLSTFHVFNQFDYLVGSTSKSKFEGVELIFETRIDMTFRRSEKISIVDAIEVVDALEADNKNVRVVKNDIYPIGSGFDTKFFHAIKDTIKEVKL